MFDHWHQDITIFLDELSESLSLELVELNIRRLGKVIQVEVFVDKETGGITMDECSAVDRQLSRYIEEKNLIADDYVVEVSSPGLDRPLKTKKDFLRAQGTEVRFHLIEMVEGKKEHSGIVKVVEEHAVYVETKKITVVIPFDKIQKAVLIID